MTQINKYTLRNLEQDDLELVLRWRNSDHIRKFMYKDNIISFDEHQAWYDRIEMDKTKIYLIFSYKDQPAGLIYFTEINDVDSNCIWGFYLGEHDIPKGSGTVMGYLAMKYIFEQKGIRKVSGEVLGFNEPSRKFFARLGFTEEGIKRKHILRDDKYIDVYLFSLLANEWSEKYKDELENMFSSNE